MTKIYILLAQENFKAFEILGAFEFKAQAKLAKIVSKKHFTYHSYLIMEKTIGRLCTDSNCTDIFQDFN